MTLTDEINAISDKVLALEQENERLKKELASANNSNCRIDEEARRFLLERDSAREENESLRQQLASSVNTDAYDKLIDLVAPDIEWQEKHLTDRSSDKMKAVVQAYRAIRPK
jgi:cell shape-determining protein MreC